MATRERKAAILVQRRWRGGVPWDAEAQKALAKIQATVKGHLQREHQRADRQWAEQAEQTSKKAEQQRLLNECNAVIEKRGKRRFSLGPWELVMWQERHVSATADALVYQHVRSNAEPKGHSTEIPYAAMQSIKALTGDVLEVKVATRDYLFQLSSREECERWATNLVQLAAAAGHHVPGFIVVPEAGAG